MALTFPTGQAAGSTYTFGGQRYILSQQDGPASSISNRYENSSSSTLTFSASAGGNNGLGTSGQTSTFNTLNALVGKYISLVQSGSAYSAANAVQITNVQKSGSKEVVVTVSPNLSSWPAQIRTNGENNSISIVHFDRSNIWGPLGFYGPALAGTGGYVLPGNAGDPAGGMTAGPVVFSSTTHFTETELGPRRNTNPFFNDGAANSNYRVPYFTSHGITSTNTGTAGWMDVRTRNDKSGNTGTFDGGASINMMFPDDMTTALALTTALGSWLNNQSPNSNMNALFTDGTKRGAYFSNFNTVLGAVSGGTKSGTSQLGFFTTNPTDASTISGFEFKIEGGDNAGKVLKIEKGDSSGTTQLVGYNNSGALGSKTNTSGYDFTHTYFAFDWSVTSDDFVQGPN